MRLSDMQEKMPLVSVAVITYNSSKYVLETLESIKAQTYQNIELIVSDDCSTDNTIQLCKDWCEKNKDRFVKSNIVSGSSNIGVTGNCIQAWNMCSAKWIKTIAGDDMLLPSCIDDNLKYVIDNPEAVIVLSRPTFAGINESEFLEYENKKFDYTFFSMTKEEQYDRIKHGSCLPASTSFFNRDGFIKYDLFFDSRIPMLEDRPLWLNAIVKGVKIHFFDKPTVVYRVHETSLCNAKTLPPKFYESTRLAYFYYVFDRDYSVCKEETVKSVVEKEMIIYNEYYRLSQVTNTVAFKLCKYLTNPLMVFNKIGKFFKKHKPLSV